jgi:phosphoketolase
LRFAPKNGRATVFPRQGKFAHDPRALATCPPPDLTVNRIDELLDVELAVLLRAGRATGEDMPEITNWKWPG